ncbi:MAG: GGDEF domain-containing protein, partial [Candidatus Atribacteria bacterium]|nr:GGDEF domain-containing protein [Candidatus Atribacteria bacterium]
EHSREKLGFQKLREGQPIPEDERIVSVLTKRGEVRQIRWNYRVLSDSAGTMQGFALSGIDVTQEMGHWEELQFDHLFHWTLLDLIHWALQGESVTSTTFWRRAVASLGAVFDVEKSWYLARVDNEGFVMVGEGRDEQRCTVLRGSLKGREVFVTGLQWEGSTLILSSESGLSPFLVVPLCVSGKLEGLLLFGGRKKPFTGADVQRARVIQETLELLLYRGQTEAELLYLSSHDSLTGALNHKAFREKGEEILALAERYKRPFSLIFLDVDDFKSINDRFGHLFGDRMLSFFAQHLRANLRRNDLLARFGGDEFVLLLPETPGAKAWELLERLQSNPLLLEEGDEVILLRFSAGMSVYPEDGKTLEALMEMADLRMYEKKKAGKEKV